MQSSFAHLPLQTLHSWGMSFSDSSMYFGIIIIETAFRHNVVNKCLIIVLKSDYVLHILVTLLFGRCVTNITIVSNIMHQSIPIYSPFFEPLGGILILRCVPQNFTGTALIIFIQRSPSSLWLYSVNMNGNFRAVVHPHWF